jgi:hypothetical protein
MRSLVMGIPRPLQVTFGKKTQIFGGQLASQIS